ncbi:MAG: hypothetical protein L6R40_006573 [Gallowayella cf. fulva]|nr:MAG: hypothetical protein L6R40_006573 [Xanthomendoza cf. fulva]
MLLCFPVEQESRTQVIGTLQQASAALLKQIPILAGKVENHQDSNTQGPTSGTFRVVPYDHPNGSSVRVNILDDFITYHELRTAQAPASMLDANILAPMKGLPHHYGDTDITPVFIVQANFIPGGLLLCFSGMHTAMDATGLGKLIKMFATLCRRETLSAAHLAVANLDRTQLPVALKPGETTMDHPELASRPDDGQTDDSAVLPGPMWAYFNIPTPKLKELKAEGSRDLTSEVPWVSTNDVVTAWLWRAVTHARWSHIDTDEDSMLLRAVTGRRQLNVADYIGNVVTCPCHKLAIKTLVEEPLSKITQTVRAVTNSIDAHYVRSFASFIASAPDKDKLVLGFNSPDRDLMVSSWAAAPCYESFGESLGRADLVRRPTSPWSSVVYIMPTRPDGSLDLLVSLREDDMERLRNDERFAAVAHYIG